MRARMSFWLQSRRSMLASRLSTAPPEPPKDPAGEKSSCRAGTTVPPVPETKSSGPCSPTSAGRQVAAGGEPGDMQGGQGGVGAGNGIHGRVDGCGDPIPEPGEGTRDPVQDGPPDPGGAVAGRADQALQVT